jgi:hypothetical protein
MDFATITAGIAAARTGLDTIKTAVGMVKEAKDMLPNGEQKDKTARALEDAALKLAEGESAVAQALGFNLCRCEFPPTPMLMVGHVRIMSLTHHDRQLAMARQVKHGGMTGSVAVHECPKCKTTDAPSYTIERTVRAPSLS